MVDMLQVVKADGIWYMRSRQQQCGWCKEYGVNKQYGGTGINVTNTVTTHWHNRNPQRRNHASV
jgi:hypothetical protein